MLKEMRDVAGDSGEFYTPRPVVRFIVEVIDPKLGETILDPACGTGGFLVETYKKLEQQCHAVEDMEALQKHTIFGGEAKPLPYMLVPAAPKCCKDFVAVKQFSSSALTA
jgi:type I restriction enzyme M protein